MSTKLKSADLLDVVKGKIEITDGVGTIDNKAVQNEAFEKLGTDLATVKSSYDAVAVVNNAIAEEFVNASQEYLVENKDHDNVTLKTNVGDEELYLERRRNSTSRNPKTGEVIENKGALTVRRTIKNRNSETSNIKQLAKETGLKKL